MRISFPRITRRASLARFLASSCCLVDFAYTIRKVAS